MTVTRGGSVLAVAAAPTIDKTTITADAANACRTPTHYPNSSLINPGTGSEAVSSKVKSLDAVIAARLDTAVLRDANLAGARLTGANLKGADLTGAVITGVTWSNTTCPDGTNSNAHAGTCIGHL